MKENNIVQSETKYRSKIFIMSVLFRTVLLLIICNLLFAAFNISQPLGEFSGYNLLFPGRDRLPWSENPSISYNLSLNNLDAMFLSQSISGIEKMEDEYRVLLLGDSSAWGFLLSVNDTLAGNINQAELVTADGKSVRAYNLAYPTSSLTKDLLLLDYGMRYQPDIIIWMVTLEAFPYDKQILIPIVKNNSQRVIKLINEFDLNINPSNEEFYFPSFWDRTIIGQRRELADLIRLQLYGVMWAATGIDQYLPEEYDLRQSDFEADDSFYDFQPPELSAESLAFDVLSAGIQLAGDIPVLIVNEPIYITEGENSEIRYNLLYPHWAYDSYRRIFAEYAISQSWAYLDLWNVVPSDEFTNTAVHVTPYGVSLLSSYLKEAIITLATGDFTSYIYTE